MSDNLTTDLLDALKKKYPNISGNLFISKSSDDVYSLTGELVSDDSTILDFIENWAIKSKVKFGLISVKLKASDLSVISTESSPASTVADGILDKVSVIYRGDLPLGFIKSEKNPDYKRTNFEIIEKVRASYEVVGFLSPIILASDLSVIDGNLRLEVARRAGLEKVPVVIINTSDARADFLRLVLNRSSEFQRWVYGSDETRKGVDEYVDEWPQLQPVLEPLGFFSNTVLPISFFGNTIIEYRIDEFNDQMKAYSQDFGLADWAKHQRDAAFEREERKKKIENSRPEDKNFRSLFDLEVKEEDFLPTADVEEATALGIEELTKLSAEITDKYDAKRKAEIKEKGGVWQNSRRTSKKLAEDKRAAFEAEKRIKNELGENEND